MADTRRSFLQMAAVAAGLAGGMGASGLVNARSRVPALAQPGSPAGGSRSTVELPGAPTVFDPYQGMDGLTWWKGQVHTHTARSFDGDPSVPPERRAAGYRAMGYDFVVLTDHDRVSAVSPAAAPAGSDGRAFLAIPGVESTHPSAHLGVWFFGEEAGRAVVDPPLVPADRAPAARMEAWAEAGALVSANHPNHPSAPLTAEQVASWAGGGVPFRFLEVFNTLATRSADDLAYSVEVWRRAVAAAGPQRPVWAVAADDSHGQSLGQSWISVGAPSLTPAALREALLAGRFYASNGPAFTILGVSPAAGGIAAVAPGASVVRFIADDGNVAYQAAGEAAVYRPAGAARWVRVEASDAAGRTAWSQPFWLDA